MVPCRRAAQLPGCGLSTPFPQQGQHRLPPDPTAVSAGSGQAGPWGRKWGRKTPEGGCELATSARRSSPDSLQLREQLLLITGESPQGPMVIHTTL